MKTPKRFLYATMAILGAVSAGAKSPGNANRWYDPTTETTIKGNIEQVTQPSRGQMAGMHLFVKTDERTTEVALGPSAFVGGKWFSFAKGDAVEVTGSKLTLSGKEYIIAREVVKDGKTLTLRDKNGIPEWAGLRGSRRGGN